MGARVPKQYLPLLGRPIIEHTLERLCTTPRVSGVVVAVSENDGWWPDVRTACKVRPLQAPGGEERCHSVLNALRLLEERAGPDDWVMVHDAVRPCLRTADVERLVSAVADHPVGGLLALPVRDTMKRADPDGQVEETVSRDALWHALTPQMFRLGVLRAALEGALADGVIVTDESQAVERAGGSPLLVEGHGDNIKITRAGDLPLAELYMKAQEQEACA